MQHMSRKRLFFILMRPLAVMTLLLILILIYQTPWKQLLGNPLRTWPMDYTVQQHRGPIEQHRIVRVYDGDTVELENGEKVRLLGINTPETHHPQKPVECYGITAAAYTQKLLEGKTVITESDNLDRDKYERLLRYIFIPKPGSPNDQLFVNALLVGKGYAQVYAKDINSTYATELFALEHYAQQQKRGMWGSCTKEDLDVILHSPDPGRE